MSALLTLFGEAGGFLFFAAVISTMLLTTTFAADRLLGRRLLTIDAIWAATLSLLLLAPLAVVLWPSHLAGRLWNYVPRPAAIENPLFTPLPLQGPAVSSSPELFQNRPNRAWGVESPTSQADANGRRNLEIPYAVIAVVIAAAGATVSCARLIVSYRLCRRLCNEASLCDSRLWLDRLERHQITLGMRRSISLRVSAQTATPIVIGWLHPVIVIPQELLTTANIATADAILLHELTHVARNDYVTQIGWKACECIYWWNPLIWLATRRVSTLRELVCDSFCVAKLPNRHEYIDALLKVARLVVKERSQPVAVPMARTSRLEFRLRCLEILGVSELRSGRTTRWGLKTLTLLLALALGAVNDFTNAAVQTEGTEPSAANNSPSRDGGAKGPIVESTEKPAAAPMTEADARLQKFLRATKPEPNVVAGVCVDEAREPLSGVEVSLYVYVMGIPGASDAKQTRRLAVQTTGADGRFLFHDAIDVSKEYPNGLPPEHFQVPPTKVIALVARAPGRATAWDNGIAALAVRRGTVDVMNLPPAAVLRGKITDREGQPVADAVVTAGMNGGVIVTIPGVLFHSALTDIDGKYAIDDVSAYDQENARKEHEAWAKQFNAESASFQTAAGALSPNPSAFKPRTLLVQHPQFASSRAVISQIPGILDVTLQPGAVITGRAVYREGQVVKPASSIRVILQRYSDMPDMPRATADSVDLQSYEVRSELTDDQGKYRVASLPPGTYTIGADADEEWISTGVNSVSAEAGQTTTAPEVIFTHGGVIRARLVDADTGKSLSLPGGVKGWLNANHAPGSSDLGLTYRNPIVTFSESGVADRHVPAGRYIVFASIPDEKGMPQLTSIEQGKPLDQWPTYEIAEGQTLDVTLSMRRDAVAKSATGSFSRAAAAVVPADSAEDSDGEQPPASESDSVNSTKSK